MKRKRVSSESDSRLARFPPLPRSFRGRAHELRTLEAVVRAQHPTILALVGGGGSGKSTLASVLGHRLRRDFDNRLLWVRIGAWDQTTVMQMMAIQLGEKPASDPTKAVRKALSVGRSLVVLDNHEDDRVTAGTLEALRDLPVTWIITARRCLLGGVTIFPVVPALVALQKSPFPAVAKLTRLLRWHPVALDLADALVANGFVTDVELELHLRARGVDRVTPLAHEDDVPEVRGVVQEGLRHLWAVPRRMLGALAHMRGDHMDRDSLAKLSTARGRADASIEALLRLRLVQEPWPGRYALHATVHYALRTTLPFDEDAIARHYLEWLEKRPDRILAEQSHLFALMDWAQEKRDLDTILRVHALAALLEQAGAS